MLFVWYLLHAGYFFAIHFLLCFAVHCWLLLCPALLRIALHIGLWCCCTISCISYLSGELSARSHYYVMSATCRASSQLACPAICNCNNHSISATKDDYVCINRNAISLMIRSFAQTSSVCSVSLVCFCTIGWALSSPVTIVLAMVVVVVAAFVVVVVIFVVVDMLLWETLQGACNTVLDTARHSCFHRCAQRQHAVTWLSAKPLQRVHNASTRLSASNTRC